MQYDADRVEQDPRWTAVVARVKTSDRSVIYAVKTTGIYCRTGCPSRRPLPKNVEFFDTSKTAEAKGYRSCRRCHPNEASNR